MEGNIISFKVFVNSKGILMSEYRKLPVEKVTSVFVGTFNLKLLPVILSIALISAEF